MNMFGHLFGRKPKQEPKPEEKPPKVTLVGLDYLQHLTRFSFDPRQGPNDLAGCEVGDKLEKSGAVLAGTSVLAKPKYKNRILVYVTEASVADGLIDDPWKIVVVDRPALFTVADVYDHGDVRQVTLVEATEKDFGAADFIVLDEEAREATRHLLVDSYAVPAAPYCNDTIYRRIMSNPKPDDKDGREPERFYFYSAPEPEQSAELPHSPKTADASLDANDPRFKTAFCIQDPWGGEGSYRLLLEKKMLEGCDDVARLPQYLTYEVAHLTAGHMEVIGKMQGGTVFAADGFVSGFVNSSMDKVIKITDKGHLASGNVNVFGIGNPYTRMASWVRDVSGGFTVTYQQPDPRYRTSFDTFEEMTLYLFATIGLTVRRSLEERVNSRQDEAHLADAPEHYVFWLSDSGRCIVRASKERHDGHPALAYIEARENGAKLTERAIDKMIVTSAYNGRLIPLGDRFRDIAADGVWFDPLKEESWEPIKSDATDGLVEEMRKAFDEAHRKDPVGTMSEAEFGKLVSNMHARADGDTYACAVGIDQAASEVVLPYRYEFSYSFDIDTHEARINLFLPQRAIFPSTAANPKSGVAYETLCLDERHFNEMYNRVAFGLGNLTLGIVKHMAPWATTVRLNALYRTDLAPLCLYALSTNETDLGHYNLGQTDVAQTVMKELGAHFVLDKDKGLLEVPLAFEITEALDQPVGFYRFRGGWTVPYPLDIASTLREDDSPTEMANRAVRMAEDGRISDAYGYACECLEKLESDLPLRTAASDMRPISCNTKFEYALAKTLAGDEKLVELPSGIAFLRQITGGLCVDLGNVAEARERLESALEIDPVSPGTLFELANLELSDGNGEAARTYADEAYRVAATMGDAAKAYRFWGHIASEDEEDYDLALRLYLMALLISKDDENIARCETEVTWLVRERGISFPPNGENIRDTIVARGYPVIPSAAVRQVSEASVREALHGGALPDVSFVKAYLASTRGEKTPSDALPLIAQTLGGHLGTSPFYFYLHHPVLLSDVDVLDFVSADSPLLSDDIPDHELGLVCVPYIDDEKGLSFEVVGSMGKKTREIAKLCDGNRFSLVADGVRDSEFVVLRPQDYPDLPLEAWVSKVASSHATTEGRDRTRGIRSIDHLRDYENPDVIVAILTGDGNDPEGAWVRLDAIVDESHCSGTLMGEPFDDFGRHRGDSCLVELRNDDELGGMLAYIVA